MTALSFRCRIPFTGVAVKSATLRHWPRLPLLLLLLALATVFLFGNDRGYFYRPGNHNGLSSSHITVAANRSLEHNLLGFHRQTLNDDGSATYVPYNRFPIGGSLLIKLVILPFGDDLSAQIYAARMLMLAFFVGAGVMAFLAISRITTNNWIALAVTLFAFSATYWLYYNDSISTEVVPDVFGGVLVFHGMTIFAHEGRFRQLLIKACLALLLGWHVYAMLLPFIVFGLLKTAVRARAAHNVSSPTGGWRRQLAVSIAAAAAAVRSRYMKLGVAALLFGMLLLGFNFGSEYIALNGEKGLTELPSYRSMLKRTGQNADYNLTKADLLAWGSFLERQFHRLGWMSLPYSPLNYFERLDVFSETPPPQTKAVIVGGVVAAVCLAGLALVRHKILLATLALSGFVWSIAMRHNTADHPFEGLAYTGIPLTFFLLILLSVHRLWGNRAVAWLAAAALLVFCWSSFQMSHVSHDAQAAQWQRDIVADFQTIRRITEGKSVVIPRDVTNWWSSWAFADAWYYLSGSSVLLKDRGDKMSLADFFLMNERDQGPALLTPNNRAVFLYDREAYIGQINKFMEETGDPVIRSDFDVYRYGNRLIYVKDACGIEDTVPRFFMHIFPVDDGDLPKERRQHRFNNHGFYFENEAFWVDDQCLAIVWLPDYGIDSIRTGQYIRGADGAIENIWQGEFRWDGRQDP